MDYTFLALLWVLNFAISWFNAYQIGKAWAEIRAAGGIGLQILLGSAAVMSASGFIWCYLIAEVLGLHSLGYLDLDTAKAVLNLGWLLIIPGVILSGIAITLHSWAQAFRNGGFVNYGVAVWNTYAQIHNTMSAINGFGDALSGVASYFKSKESMKSLFVVVLVLIAVVAGIATTWAIVHKYAAREPLPDQLKAAQG